MLLHTPLSQQLSTHQRTVTQRPQPRSRPPRGIDDSSCVKVFGFSTFLSAASRSAGLLPELWHHRHSEIPGAVPRPVDLLWVCALSEQRGDDALGAGEGPAPHRHVQRLLDIL
eukprot:6206801-Pleurochrysis_carterae.AAC.1